jgi:fimbrial chaperone protein
MRRSVTLMCAALMLATTAPVVAGSFSVSPTRVEFSNEHRTEVVTLRNAANTPLTVQVSLAAWNQLDGEDQYVDTRELLTTPPVFTLAPNTEQIVRVALRRPADPARELSYRIFFQEVPQAAQIGANSLNVALRVGIPVFVKPAAKQKQTPGLRWDVHRLADNKLQVEAINDGALHVQVTDFELGFGESAEPVGVGVVRYVLPGSRVSWVVDGNSASKFAAKADIRAYTDFGQMLAEAQIAAP